MASFSYQPTIQIAFKSYLNYIHISYNTCQALTLLAANMSVFGSSHSPPHGHNSNEVHQHFQPK